MFPNENCLNSVHKKKITIKNSSSQTKTLFKIVLYLMSII